MVSKKKNPFSIWGWERKKNDPCGHLVMPIGDLRDGYFNPTPTLMMDPYITDATYQSLGSLTPFVRKKRFEKFLPYNNMGLTSIFVYVTRTISSLFSLYHLIDVTRVICLNKPCGF